MGGKKVTRMLLKVDLQCSKCYKKVKKVLCQFSSCVEFLCTRDIRDQAFDEKANTVTIKVVCCSPEKIRDKIRCKGGASIESIEIIPDKPKKEDQKKKDSEKGGTPPGPGKQPEITASDESKRPKGPKEPPSPKRLKEPEKPLVQPIVLPGPAPGYSRTCYMECYEGHGGGPYNQMCYGQPMRYYDGYCGRPIYDSWGSGKGYRPCYVGNNSGGDFSDENPSACSIM